MRLVAFDRSNYTLSATMNKSGDKRLQEIFLIKRDIILYLDKYGLMSYLEEQICDFHNKTEGDEKDYVFFCPLKIDLFKAADISERLINTLINEPNIFKTLVNEICHIVICCVLKINNFNPNQIIVPLIPNFLPNIKKFQIHPEGLTSFLGILTELSSPQKYIRSTVWKCQNHKEASQFFQRAPLKSVHCGSCSNICHEIVNLREMGNLIHGVFVNSESFDSNNQFNRHRSIFVKLRDPYLELKLGSTYKITGVLKNDSYTAWNCEEYIPRPISIHLLKNIQYLYTRCSHSPWLFVFILAMQTGKHIYPELTFMHLKMGLLLSLASFNLENSTPIPILAIGNDTLIAHRLFNNAVQLAERCVRPMPGTPLVGQLRKDDWYEAGPLHLGKNGICLLGDWDSYTKEKDGYIVRSVIESGQINTQTCPSYLNTTVWTYWCCPKKPKHISQMQTLIDIFGLPFISDPPIDIDPVVDAILMFNSGNNSFKADIPVEEIKQFLVSINTRTVVLNADAQNMIKDYFVASRKARPGCLPLQALNLITNLSKAHARISLRDEVILQDVIAIIYLYEEAMKHIFEPYDVCSPPDININNISQVDAEMLKFSFWLEEYVSETL